MARKALKDKKPDKAIQLVASLANEMDVDALIITGDALLAKNDYEGAIENLILVNNFKAIIDFSLQAEEEGEIEIASMGFAAAYELNPENGTIPLANFMESNKLEPIQIEKLLEAL